MPTALGRLDLRPHGRGVLLLASRPGQLPIARQILRRINDAGAAADVDPPQRLFEETGIDFLVRVPGRMVGRQRTQFQVRLGKHLGHQLAKAPIEIAAAATLLGKQESAAVDVHPQPLDLGVGELRRVAAVDEQDRRLQQIFDRGHLRDRSPDRSDRGATTARRG